MEPAKQTPRVVQHTPQKEIRVQLPPEQPNFLSKIWSAVKGIFSYIGHLFATLFHLKTTKKTEDIKAEHPVQGKPAATSVKVDAAKDVPPLDTVIPKTEKPPRAPTPPPPSVPAPPAFSKAVFLDQKADEISQCRAALERSYSSSMGTPEGTIEELIRCVEQQYQLDKNQDLYDKRLALIEKHNRDLSAILHSTEFPGLFGETSLQGLKTWRSELKRFLFDNLRQNMDSPTMTFDNILLLVQGIQNRFRLQDDEIKLLEQLKDAKWVQSSFHPPVAFIQWVISMVIDESKVALPKTLDEEWDAFLAFNERMNHNKNEFAEMLAPLRKAKSEAASKFFLYDPFPTGGEISRLESWMRDYHKFDAACPNAEITIDCPHDELLDSTKSTYLLSHQLVWKPAEGKFYVKLGHLDWMFIHETGQWLDEERPISKLDKFIGVSYTAREKATVDGEEFWRIDVEDELYFNSEGEALYKNLKVAFSPTILKEMIQKLRDQKDNKPS